MLGCCEICPLVNVEGQLATDWLTLKTGKPLISNQSGAAEAWWAHNPQVPGSKPGSDKSGFRTF